MFSFVLTRSPIVHTVVYTMGMGKMEQKAQIKEKHARVRRAILLALYGTSTVALALLAPNAVKLLQYIDPDINKKRDPATRIREAAKRLEKRGLLKRTQAGWTLTKAGESEASVEKIMDDVGRRARTQKWDGLWRVVIFDVWERRRATRDRLRLLLIETGFIRLQDSVWIYPYDCEEFIAYARTELKLGAGLIYIIAQGVENEVKLRTIFKLPSL